MGRKYPTLRPPGKERFVRFKTLGKIVYTGSHSSADIVPEAPLYTSSSLARPPCTAPTAKARKLTGLRALYYRYLYELGALPRKPQRPRYAVRQDIRNLDKRIRQMEFLSSNEIDTLGQLDAYRQTKEQAVGSSACRAPPAAPCRTERSRSRPD